MNVLALETSMNACSVAVWRERAGSSRFFARFQPMERGHAEALMPMIRVVLGEAHLEIAEIDRVAVTVGPGSFSGVRLGIATARGLAIASRLDLVAETSLRVMARGALLPYRRAISGRGIVVAVDARRDDLYVQTFDKDARAMTAPQLLPVYAAVDALPDSPVVLLGSGADALQAAAEDRGISLEVVGRDVEPDAATLARLALDLPPLTEKPSPLYLRAPDARPQTSGVALADDGAEGAAPEL